MGHSPEGKEAIAASRTTWTAQQDALLIKLWKEGKSASKIAEQFPDKSRNAVIGRVHRLRARGKDYAPRPREPGRPRKPLSRDRIIKLAPKPIPVIVDTLEGSAAFNERTGCKWPVTPRPPHRFCNRTRIEGAPYCEGHMARAIQPREMRRGKYEVPFG